MRYKEARTFENIHESVIPKIMRNFFPSISEYFPLDASGERAFNVYKIERLIIYSRESLLHGLRYVVFKENAFARY